MDKPFQVGDPIVFVHPKLTNSQPVKGSIVISNQPENSIENYTLKVTFEDGPDRFFTTDGRWLNYEEPTLFHADSDGWKPEWTFVLLYPEYLRDSNDHETYITTVRAENFVEGLKLAKQEASDKNQSLGALEEDECPETNPDDFYCIAAVEGNHNIWSEE